MKTISIRDFQRNFYKHIKDGEDIVVTKGKEEVFVVTFYTNDVVTIDAPEAVKPKVKAYACGCSKIQGDLLCAKHNRL